MSPFPSILVKLIIQKVSRYLKSSVSAKAAMKFSIVTPSYNQGQYIAQTLDSVLEQQPSCEIEHLVMDGGSTDNTLEVLTNYERQYPTLSWISESDKGQSDAINKGLNRAKGDIVAYLNSDDYYLPGTLAKVKSIFETNPKVDFVYGDIYMVNESGEIIRRVKSLKTSLWRHLYSFPFPQQSCFWRRHLIERIPIFNTQNKTCMDGEYFAHILSHPVTLYRLSDPLACFRLHQASISGSGRWSSLYQTDKLRIENDLMPHRKLPRKFHLLTGRLAKQLFVTLRPQAEMFSLSK
ncbi:glycosyltransferase family 2 protein [Leptothoe sp. PORK10 BA2]|uniref:glycosyltransferase family 2 protein n=1 Tax=Leptothoe sp. PORK10 BA2 TaxID=3110254 RepID=UPI002B1ED096|nr:glycosyltransferase family 2 protein [Leptothoe sp. PORK10 BA2]MEA5466504.1 glycosyltransferase family 2 protein [Leptothoe sp. PORK10 BA2]